MKKHIYFFNRILNNRYYKADCPIKIIMMNEKTKFDDVIRNSISILSFQRSHWHNPDNKNLMSDYLIEKQQQFLHLN